MPGMGPDPFELVKTDIQVKTDEHAGSVVAGFMFQTARLLFQRVSWPAATQTEQSTGLSPTQLQETKLGFLSFCPFRKAWRRRSRTFSSGRAASRMPRGRASGWSSRAASKMSAKAWPGRWALMNTPLVTFLCACAVYLRSAHASTHRLQLSDGGSPCAANMQNQAAHESGAETFVTILIHTMHRWSSCRKRGTRRGGTSGADACRLEYRTSESGFC